MEKKKIPKNESGGISRRDFLKDAGLVVGGAAIGSTVLLAACGGEETTKTVTEGTTKTVTETAPGGTVTSTVPGGTVTTTAGEVTKTVTTTAGGTTETVTITKTVEVPTGETAANVIKFTLNGWPCEVQVEPEWSLQYLLREKLECTEIKDMCMGYGACGSCTVIMDGRPVLSCMNLAIECDGAVIETSRGIAEAKHPLIEAYIKNHCMQCGFCTPGFVVTAKALMDRNPDPTEEDIRDALGGNLCRCSTYPQHILAVLEAAKEL